MGFQGLVAVLVLAAAAIFAVMNQDLVYQAQFVRIPGGSADVPLVGLLLAAAAGAVLLMLLGGMIAAAGWREHTHRLRRRVDDREREVAVMKSGDYEVVSAKLEQVRADLSGQIASLAHLIQTRPVVREDRTVVREDRPAVREERPAVREERAGYIPPR